MDTICAIATARAAAAIGVIRVSGENALSVCDEIVRLKSGSLSESKSGQMRLGQIVDGTRVLDQVLCVVFRAPASYTGEDMVEINCHGGVSLLDRVMRLLLRRGARGATGGEFTKRAFLNGKMDLLQAEAVGDLINSRSEAEASVALGQLSGALSRAFTQVWDALISLNTDILAYIDFPDEGLSDVSADTVLSVLRAQREKLCALEKSFDTGAVLRDGVDTVIVGAPNVGKSTLLNALSGSDRAIVSDIAGTTRDIVTESVTAGGVTLHLCDTAGIRGAEDVIERQGVERAKAAAHRAGLLLAVFDGARQLTDDDRAIVALCRDKTAIAVINKSDLPQKAEMEYLQKHFQHLVTVSAARQEGLTALSEQIRDLFAADRLSVESGMLLTNLRHYERVCAARRRLDSAIAAVEQGFTPDLASVDITAAASEIGMVTGAAVSDKIIDEIFSRFCVGK